MKAISCSKEEFQWLRKKGLEEKWIAIQISSNEKEGLYMSKGFYKQFEDHLRLFFADVKHEFEEEGEIYKPFSDAQYREVIEFVEKHKDADKLFVQCHMGIQRSAGIVEGLSIKYDWIEKQHGLEGDAPVYPYPNVVSKFLH